MRNIKYFFESFEWLKILFSPFKPFKLRLYVGKTQIGTPYFFPRRWVKATPTLATKAAFREIKDRERFNKSNANSKFKHDIPPFQEIYNEMMTRRHAIPLKIGFDYCSLGWKTKYTRYEIRHEWNPVYTFVFFGYQIALTITAPVDFQGTYWEPWICYEYMTDKKLSKRERIAFCKKKCPQTWSTLHKDGTKTTIDYYNLILKSKYL